MPLGENCHPIVQFLKDIFINSVFQCCAKVFQSGSFIFYTLFCKFTFCTLLVSFLSGRNTEYCLNINKAILSLSCPLFPYAVALYVLWSPLFVCLCSGYVCPNVMYVTRINFACFFNYILNLYSAFCVSRLP
jgi:hypothetical protein